MKPKEAIYVDMLRWLAVVATAYVVVVAVVGYLRFRDEFRRELADTIVPGEDHVSSLDDDDADSQRAIAA